VGGRLQRRLPGDDVIRRARIREVAQAVFPASPLGAALVGYIRRPFSAAEQFSERVNSGSLVRASQSSGVSFEES
jgi:hypothetical protein